MLFLFSVVISFIGVIGNEAEDSDGKYVDMLPEQEQQEFLDKVARRILAEVKPINVTNSSNIEISDDLLDKHSEYVQKIFKEESESLKSARKNLNETVKTREYDEENLKVKALSKADEKEPIDLTMRANKRFKRNDSQDSQEVTLTTILVPILYDESDTPENNQLYLNVDKSTILSSDVSSSVVNTTTDKVVQFVKSDKDDIQVRNFRKFTEKKQYVSEKNDSTQIKIFQTLNAEDSALLNSTVTTTLLTVAPEDPNVFQETQNNSSNILNYKYEMTPILDRPNDYNNITNGNHTTDSTTAIYLENKTTHVVTEPTIELSTIVESNSIQSIPKKNSTSNESKEYLRIDLLKSLQNAHVPEVTTDFTPEMSVPATDILNIINITTEMPVEITTTQSNRMNPTELELTKNFTTTGVDIESGHNIDDSSHLIDKLNNVLKQSLKIEENKQIVNESKELNETTKQLRSYPSDTNSKEYNVYEMSEDKPLFAVDPQKETQEQPYHIPIYNFAPNNAYYNPYNRLGPNYEDKDENKFQNDFENTRKQSKINGINDSHAFEMDYYFDTPNLRAYNGKNTEFGFERPQNRIQKKKNISDLPVVPIVYRNPKYTEIYFNPDDYLDFDYYFGRKDDYSTSGLNKLRKGYSIKDMSNEDHHVFNDMKKHNRKKHLTSVRNKLFHKSGFDNVQTKAKLKYRPVFGVENNDYFILVLPNKTKNVIRNLKKPQDIDIDYYYDGVNDENSFKIIRKKGFTGFTDQQWSKEKEIIKSEPVKGQIYKPLYNFYNDHAIYEDQIETSNNVLFRIKQFGKFRQGLDTRYDLWKAMFQVPYRLYNSNLQLVKNLTSGGWLTRKDERQLRRILINLKFKNNRMFRISRNKKVNKNWKDPIKVKPKGTGKGKGLLRTLDVSSNQKNNDLSDSIIPEKSIIKLNNFNHHVSRNDQNTKSSLKYKNQNEPKISIVYFVTRKSPNDKVGNYLSTIKHIQDSSNTELSFKTDQISTSNSVIFRLYKFGKFDEGLDTKQQLMKAINRVPDRIYDELKQLIIHMTFGKKHLTKRHARNLLKILINMKMKRYSFFNLAANLRKLSNSISKDSDEVISVDELLKILDSDIAINESLLKDNKRKEFLSESDESEVDTIKEIDINNQDSAVHRRFTSAEKRKITEINELMNIPKVPIPDFHKDQIETAKLTLFRIHQFGKFKEGLDIRKQLLAAINKVPGDVIESIIDILYNMQEDGRLTDKERVRLERILYQIKDKNLRFFNLYNWSADDKTKKAKPNNIKGVIKKKGLRHNERIYFNDDKSENFDFNSKIIQMIKSPMNLDKLNFNNNAYNNDRNILNDKHGNGEIIRNTMEAKKLLSDENFNVYLKTLEDMIRGANKALKQYDWLGTAVDVRSAINKLEYLSNELQNNVYIHPSDLELLKYSIHLHKHAKTIYNRIVNNKRDISQDHFEMNLGRSMLPKKKIGGKLSNPIGHINRFFSYMRKKELVNKARLSSNSVIEFKSFLSDIKHSLNDLHTALKHIASITKYKKQRWYENLKEIYLQSPTKKTLLEMLLHIFTTRLFGLVEESCSDGLEANFVDYIENNDLMVERTLQEILFIMKLLSEIKNI